MSVQESKKRIVSASSVAYDGHEMSAALASLARCGLTHVELAYIVGYAEPFDESAFTDSAAAHCRSLLGSSGLECFAMSAHIDLGTANAASIFPRRMEFARAIGARVINTNASLRSLETQFRKTIDALARHGENIGLQIGLENPGNGEDNLFNVAGEGHALLARLGLPGIGLNFDPANLASHRPEADVTANTIASLPDCIHVHLKDVKRDAEGWVFTSLGDGDLDFPKMLPAIAGLPHLPLSVELPLRLRRAPNAQPIRAAHPLPIAEIEAALTKSLDYIKIFGL